jgi:hypothetical protein
MKLTKNIWNKFFISYDISYKLIKLVRMILKNKKGSAELESSETGPLSLN